MPPDSASESATPVASSRHPKQPLVDPEAVLRRVEVLRFLHNARQKDITDLLGLVTSNYSNWKERNQLIEVEHAARIAYRYRVTLDWLYLGKEEGLTVMEAERLRDADRKLPR